MNTSRLSAGASAFAHFAGFARKSRAAEDDQTDEPKGKKGKAAEEEDDDKSASEDDDQSDDQPKGKKGRKARAADDDGDAGDKDGKKGSRASDDDDDDSSADEDDDGKSASEDDDDDGDEDMKGKGARADAFRRGVARCAAIFGHPSAAHNLPLACSLAFETSMSRREAIAVLKGQGSRSRADDQPRGNRHAREDRSSRNVSLSSDQGAPTGKQAIAGSWNATFEKLGVKLR